MPRGTRQNPTARQTKRKPICPKKGYPAVSVSLRFDAGGVDNAKVTIKYGASGGYFSYDYLKSGDMVSIAYTGSGKMVDFHVLLPARKASSSVLVGGSDINFSRAKIENSDYLDFSLPISGVQEIIIILK